MLDKLEQETQAFMLKRQKVGKEICTSGLKLRKKVLIASVFNIEIRKFNQEVHKIGFISSNISLMLQNIKLMLDDI